MSITNQANCLRGHGFAHNLKLPWTARLFASMLADNEHIFNGGYICFMFVNL